MSQGLSLVGTSEGRDGTPEDQRTRLFRRHNKFSQRTINVVLRGIGSMHES